jgi:cytochrome c biogenesis protein CcdA
LTIGSIGAGFLAGILSTLSPCVLPLLPLVLGAAASAHRAGAALLALGLAVSFTASGLFVATIGFAIGLDGDFFRTVSAILLGLIGIVLVSSAWQSRLALAAGGMSNAASRLLQHLSPRGAAGQFVVGLVLGLVWSPCVGPTLGAASLLAAQGRNLGNVAVVMLAFGLGTSLPLLVIGGLSREAIVRWRGRLLAAGHGGKLVMGIATLAVAVLILTGSDRGVEAALVNASPMWLTDLTTRF